MLDPNLLLQELRAIDVTHFVGVPDSTLEPFLRVVRGDHGFEVVTASNECEATGLALGQYLGTGNPSLIYLQNSGFGKTIHPVTSLLTKEIFCIPALFLIGWRGMPDAKKDEPQHAKMGQIMPDLLRTLDIPFEILSDDRTHLKSCLHKARLFMKEQRTPFALVVPPELFSDKERQTESPAPYPLKRQELLEIIASGLSGAAIVSTTGKTSRELFYLRESRSEPHASDFYTVGGMGCASSIALGLARARPDRLVCVLDGDGAALMQLGSWTTIGLLKPGNLLHVLIDNEVHESTGGQPTASQAVDFALIAKGCGYTRIITAQTSASISEALNEFKTSPALTLLHVKVSPGSNPKLGRPTETPTENVTNFMQWLRHHD